MPYNKEPQWSQNVGPAYVNGSKWCTVLGESFDFGLSFYFSIVFLEVCFVLRHDRTYGISNRIRAKFEMMFIEILVYLVYCFIFGMVDLNWLIIFFLAYYYKKCLKSEFWNTHKTKKFWIIVINKKKKNRNKTNKVKLKPKSQGCESGNIKILLLNCYRLFHAGNIRLVKLKIKGEKRKS